MRDDGRRNSMETNRRWPVDWTGIWVGALTALAVGLVVGLTGYAVGAHSLATRGIDWGDVRLISAIFAIGGAFFSFVAGGWVAARIAGYERAESAMLHGAIAWLVALPILVAFSAIGATTGYGGWYGGLTAGPIGTALDPATAEAFRNTALAAVTAILLGLVGSVLGGWMASGEPMTLTYHRRRSVEPEVRARRAA
jgi:hypothetical protein